MVRRFGDDVAVTTDALFSVMGGMPVRLEDGTMLRLMTRSEAREVLAETPDHGLPNPEVYVETYTREIMVEPDWIADRYGERPRAETKRS